MGTTGFPHVSEQAWLVERASGSPSLRELSSPSRSPVHPAEEGTGYVYGNNSNDSTGQSFDTVMAAFRQGLLRHTEPVTVVLIVFYVFIFLASLFGNLMVMLVVMLNKNMRSVTNFFLLNVAVADLLVTLVCIPLTVGERVYPVWVYGLFLCKAVGYLQGVCITASVLTIMMLSLDRYVAIRHPVKSRQITSMTHVRLALVVIWVLSGSIMVPLAVVRDLATHPLPNGESLAYCHENWNTHTDRRIFDIFLFVFIYVIPGIVVIFCYSSTGCMLLSRSQALNRQDSEVYQSYRIIAGRRRLARMLLILAILFASSWMPYHAVSLYLDFSTRESLTRSLPALSFALLLGHSHSGQNPVLYFLMNHSFRRGMISLLRCRGPAEISRTESCRPGVRETASTKLLSSRNTSRNTRTSTEHPAVKARDYHVVIANPAALNANNNPVSIYHKLSLGETVTSNKGNGDSVGGCGGDGDDCDGALYSPENGHVVQMCPFQGADDSCPEGAGEAITGATWRSTAEASSNSSHNDYNHVPSVDEIQLQTFKD